MSSTQIEEKEEPNTKPEETNHPLDSGAIAKMWTRLTNIRANDLTSLRPKAQAELYSKNKYTYTEDYYSVVQSEMSK